MYIIHFQLLNKAFRTEELSNKYYLKRKRRSHFCSVADNKVTFSFIHLFTCAYIVWVISPPTLSLLLPSVPGRSCSAFVTSFVEEKRQAE
jgi:hypothetical protein